MSTDLQTGQDILPESFVQASGTQAQVLALLSQQSFSVTNPGLKNNDFGCLFPLCTLLHNKDLTIVSLVGNTTRRAER